MVQNHCTYTCIISKLSWATCMFHKMMNEYMCKKKIIIKKSCIFFIFFTYRIKLIIITQHWPKLHTIGPNYTSLTQIYITDPNFTSLTITTPHWLYTPLTNYTPLTLNNSLLTIYTPLTIDHYYKPLTSHQNYTPLTLTIHHWPLLHITDQNYKTLTNTTHCWPKLHRWAHWL